MSICIKLASVPAQAGLCPTCLKNPKTGFLIMQLIYFRALTSVKC